MYLLKNTFDWVCIYKFLYVTIIFLVFVQVKKDVISSFSLLVPCTATLFKKHITLQIVMNLCILQKKNITKQT